MNHIATGRALSPGGELLPPHQEIAMAMKMAVESMEMAPGAISHPGRVPEQRLLSPNFVCNGGGAVELYLGKR
jgi:hypothetical protein